MVHTDNDDDDEGKDDCDDEGKDDCDDDNNIYIYRYLQNNLMSS